MSESRIAIRIEEAKKTQWQDAVEESREYESLTHLIQLAVNNELNGSHGDSGGGETSVSYDPEVSNVEILEAIRGVQRDLKAVSEDVGEVKSEVVSSGVPNARRFFDLLPESESEAVTPEQVASGLEYTDTEEARDVLERLEKETGRVKETVMVGETHYYKEV
jgi:hypothetical protein